jgi:murein DD-endopeptidase MepM/ murein hydrolase activator NlpD
MNVTMKIQKQGEGRLSLLIFISLLFALFFFLCSLPKDRALRISRKPVEVSPPAPVNKAPSWTEAKITIQRGMTLTDILQDYGLSPAEIYRMRQDVKPIYDLAKIKAGREFRIYTDASGIPAAYEYDIDRENYLLIHRLNGAFSGEIVRLTFDSRVSMIYGVITDNPIATVVEQGEQVKLALMLTDIFAWDIDFYTELRKGDSFKIIFEKKYRDGNFIDYGNILSAEFTNQGKTFRAFRYVYPDTKKWGYYAFNGDSMRREFIKSPISFARITSRFTSRRLHPIRKVYRAHYGVDYAAPIGTPVQATADGTVTFVGRNGGAGRMVRVRHKNSYETMYLHLSRYGPGVKKGARIQAKDVVGYVGNSGESTGPHLDYRMKYRGSYINPLSWKFQPVEPLRAEFLRNFQEQAQGYLFVLDAPFYLARLFEGNPLPLPFVEGD